MKVKQLLKCICFCALALTLVVSVSYIVRTNGDVKDRFTGFYAEPHDTIDVMIYGASPAGGTFVPGLMWHETGITSYPLSSNSQNPIAIRYLIDETFKYQHPKLLVIEPRMFCTDMEQNLSDKAHIREVTDNMKYSVNRIRLINALLSDEDDKIEYYFDIIKYHSNFGMLLIPSELKRFDYRELSSSKGFSYEERFGDYEYDESVDTEAVIPIPEENEKVLRDLLEYLGGLDTQVLFVSTPRVLEQEYEGNMNYIAGIVESYGYEFLNLNRHFEDMDLRFDCDFYDGVHVNILGAYVSTHYLGRYIKEHYDVAGDHKRINEGTWDAAYEEYMQLYDPLKTHVEWKLDTDLTTRER